LSNSDNISQGSLIQRVTRGFTIIELLVVIAIIGVLSTIGVVSFSSIQSNARNTQRSSKVTILSEALEKYYDKNGEYPSCAAMTADSNTVTTTTLKGLDPDVLTSPTGTKGTNSISCIDSPSPDSFAYVGGLTQYTLKYKEEDSSTVPILDSRRHVIGATYTLTLVAGTGGTVNAGGTYGANTTQTITATASTYYSFSSWSGSTGCSGGKDSSVLLDADKSCTANFTPTTIAVPSTPTVTPSTAGATTTWSWGAASCPGNTARYQYRYTNTSGYNSGLIATASTSVAFTTSTEGRTYTVTAQAECYNGVTASGMSATGSASYYRLITYQLSGSVGNASLGSTSGFGGYTEGTVATLSATPNAGSHIYQPWSGSTGCSGAAIHTITMDSYKSCSVSYMTDWIPGLSSTVLSGKYVYYINLGTFYQFYPAQTACSAIGGRVPNLQELQSISANRSAYGDNFTPDNTWSSTEYNSTYGYQVLFWDGSTYYVDKTLYYLAVRCVKG